MHDEQQADIRTPGLWTNRFVRLASAFTLPKQDWLCSSAPDAKNGSLSPDTAAQL
jgi:hypothetical protein